MPLFKGFFVSLQSIRGQYASIISTIVDYQSIVVTLLAGQYASIISTIVDSNPKLESMYHRLVCFNNFYYCRFHNFRYLKLDGQYASIISTIVDDITFCLCHCGQYASIISTIVDLAAVIDLEGWLVCFNNFYYCRLMHLLKK